MFQSPIPLLPYFLKLPKKTTYVKFSHALVSQIFVGPTLEHHSGKVLY